MRIVFMGTPEFARANLLALCNSPHDLIAVVTGLPKPSGRGRRNLETAVAAEARGRGLPIMTPRTLRSRALAKELATLKPDLFVVAAFRILPKELYSLPRRGSINVHASLLPAYRGAAPINWALINGERETGLTSFYLNEQVDRGNIILQKKVMIAPDDNFDSMYARLSDEAGPFLLETLERIESGNDNPLPQDDRLATTAPKLQPQDAQINFDQPAEQVRNFIRGLSTRPGAFTVFRGDKIKIYEAGLVEETIESHPPPGHIIPEKKRLLVQCRNSVLELTQVVPAGKRTMDGRSFKNGYRPVAGEMFTQENFQIQEKK